MAIGIALLLGFNFPQNFNSPYKSASVAEFWHRWHISLSSWLRDYVYISLGGNRKGKFMTYVNLILTMLVGGLWHGASWNFVAWGAMHGFALAAHRLWNNIMGFGKNHRYGWFLHAVCVVVTFHFVCLGWVFFRNTSFDNSLTMLGLIFSNFKPQIFWQLVQGYWGVMSLMLLGYLLHFVPDSCVERSQGAVIKMPLVAQALLVVVVIYIVIQIKSSDVQPFIYFQF
jgi:D-alanyl-lipoteichoic acid acyltransferase DltB (MBOAT superfamily)